MTAPPPGLRAKHAGPGGSAGIPKHRHSRHAWCDLLEQFQPFRAHAEFKDRKSGGVAARPRQARDQAAGYGVAGTREHDRYGSAGPLQRVRDHTASSQDDVRRELHQFRGILSIELAIAQAPANIDPHVAAHRPACFLQPLKERCETHLPSRVVRGKIHKHADAPHGLALLRTRRKRPRSRRAA